MNKNSIKKSGILIVVLGLFLFNVSESMAEDVLRVGIFPRRSVAMTVKMFTPLSEYLQNRMGRKVVIDVPPDMPAFWSRLQKGEYDLVHLNQYHYVRAHAKFGWQAILKNEEFGKDDIAAALWVLNDSKIKNISDLRGKLIMFGGGDHAMVASIMTHDLLQQAGVPDESFIGMATLHPVKSIVSVFYHQADAAGAGAGIVRLPAIKEKIDVGQMRILAQSKPLAHLPWAVRDDMPASEKEKIKISLLSLNETSSGAAVLKSAGLTGIRSATDSDYDEHRVIIKRVLDEDYTKQRGHSKGTVHAE